MRNRIVGARALKDGLDPYGMPPFDAHGLPDPRYTDPGIAFGGFSRTTATPPTLEFYSAFAEGPWETIRLFWGAAEWTSFAVAIGIFIFGAVPAGRRGLFAFLLVAWVVAASGWSLHVKVGQYYIFPAMAIAIDTVLILRSIKTSAGFWSGLAVAFRPMFVIMPAIFWLSGERRAALLCALVGWSLLGASLVLQTDHWRSFSQVTDQWIAYYFESGGAIVTPEEVEKCTRYVELVAPEGFFRKCLNRRKTLTQPIGLQSGLRATLFASLDWRVFTMGVFAFGAALLFWFALRARRAGAAARALAVASAALIVDLGAPIAHIYNNVLALPLVALLLSLSFRDRRAAVAAAVMIVGAALASLYSRDSVLVFEGLVAGALLLNAAGWWRTADQDGNRATP